MTRQHFQVIIVGSGFAGSLMAMICHRLGFSTSLLERNRHPRFAIGESSTPLANLLLEEIALEYDLDSVRPLCKWGTWQNQLPHLACGLKRGFTFYHHELDQPFGPDAEHRRQLMVGASPREEIADTHWFRADFDNYLVLQAQALGVNYWDQVQLRNVIEEPTGLRLAGNRGELELEFTADLVIDATGPRGFLHQSLRLAENPFHSLPSTQALFSHFADVRPLPDCFFPNHHALPYPAEQAAVHHIFSGGWIWVLKFNNGLTSAGVAASDKFAEEHDLRSGEKAWRRLLSRLPSLRESFEHARTVLPFIYQPRLAFRSGAIAGEHWLLLPSAAGVVDPLLSTGFPLTLLGISRLAHILKTHWQAPSFRSAVQDYSRLTETELEATAVLVGALYATMDQFDLFKELSLLYFAAASFSEAARRLGKTYLAESFLLSDHPVFSAQLKELSLASQQRLCSSEVANLCRRIREAIRPFDVAGLSDRSRDPWYPASVADLCANAPKLFASEAEIEMMLAKCGFQK